MIVRLAKALLTASFGAFLLIVGFDNIIDYQTNFAFVQHVMSMDTIPADSSLHWRAIPFEWAHHSAYAVIIASELAIGGLCVFAGWRIYAMRHLSGLPFRDVKCAAIAGLAAGFGFFFVVFILIGGEWFQMWQSASWNGQEGAFRFAVLFGVALIFVALDDG